MMRYRFIEAITSLLALLARTSPGDSPDQTASVRSESASLRQVAPPSAAPQLLRVRAEYRPSQSTAPVRRRLLAGAKRVAWNRNERYSDYGARN
jgi:hypothetical protein